MWLLGIFDKTEPPENRKAVSGAHALGGTDGRCPNQSCLAAGVGGQKEGLAELSDSPVPRLAPLRLPLRAREDRGKTELTTPTEVKAATELMMVGMILNLPACVDKEQGLKTEGPAGSGGG